MTDNNNRAELIENLKAFLLSNLQKIQEYEQAKRDYSTASAAYKALTGSEVEGGPAKKGRPKLTYLVQPVEPGSDVEVINESPDVSSWTTNDKWMYALSKSPKGMRAGELHDLIPEGKRGSANTAVNRWTKQGKAKKISDGLYLITPAGIRYLKTIINK